MAFLHPFRVFRRGRSTAERLDRVEDRDELRRIRRERRRALSALRHSDRTSWREAP